MRAILLAMALGTAQAQRVDIGGVISHLQQPWMIAVPEFRGAGGAEAVMGIFNSTLRGELEDSGVLKVIDSTHYPMNVPRRIEDFKRPSPWLTEWSGPPVNATHLTI